jgi:hypothetical protein
MIIVTLYTKSAATLLSVLDTMVLSGSVKVLAADPARLYNDVNHDDVSMPAVTIETKESLEDVKLAANLVNDDPVYVCKEDPADWQ